MGFFSFTIALLEGLFIHHQSGPSVASKFEPGLHLVNPWSDGVGCFDGIQPGFVELLNIGRLRGVTDKMGDTIFLFELFCQRNPIVIYGFSGLIAFSQEIGPAVSIDAIDLYHAWI